MFDDPKIISEYLKCKNDPIYFIETYCRDYTMADKPPIKLYEKQKQVINTILTKHRVIYMGSRQVGKTIVIILFICWLLLFFPNYTVAVLSRKQEHTNMLIAEVRDCLESILPPFNIDFSRSDQVVKKIASMLQLANKSQILAITVPKENPEEAGRGIRAGFIFIDEAAHIPQLKKILSGITYTTNRTFVRFEKQKIPYGLVLSSTPNKMTGVGEVFFQYWMAAVNGNSTFVPIRFHWSEVPEYDQKWYENAIKDKDPREVAQELDLIFLGDEHSFFPDDILINIQKYQESLEPPKAEILIDGFPLYIYEEYDPNDIYLVGVDTATRTGEAKSTVEVLSYNTNNQVAEFCKKSSTTTLCRVVKKVAQLYPNCVLIVESNGVGNQVIEYCLEDEELRSKLFYTKVRKGKRVETRYGWLNTPTTRDQLLSCCYSYVVDNLSCIKSPILCQQLISLRNKGGKIVGSPDDAVFAVGFALWAKRYGKDVILKLVNQKVEAPINDVRSLYTFRYSREGSLLGGITNTTFKPMDIREQMSDDIFRSFLEKFGGSR